MLGIDSKIFRLAMKIVATTIKISYESQMNDLRLNNVDYVPFISITNNYQRITDGKNTRRRIYWQ